MGEISILYFFIFHQILVQFFFYVESTDLLELNIQWRKNGNKTVNKKIYKWALYEGII